MATIAADLEKLKEKQLTGLPLDDFERRRAEGWLERAESIRHKAVGNAKRQLQGADARGANAMKAHLRQVERLTKEALPDYFLAQEATRLTLLIASLLLYFEADPDELAFEHGYLERSAGNRMAQLQELARDFAAVEDRTFELDAEPDLGDRVTELLEKAPSALPFDSGMRWYSKRKEGKERAITAPYEKATVQIRRVAEIELEVQAAEAILEPTEEGTILLHPRPLPDGSSMSSDNP